MITGELELDGGKRFILPGTRIGYLQQKVEFKPDDTVLQFVMTGFENSDEADEKSYLAYMIIEPLELKPAAKMSTLSGGQLRRAALARALLEEPDLLMLDEPTNHLDLNAIKWLEQYLAVYRGALICVSHDRTFLNNISQKVFWIDRGIIRTSPGGYAEFDEWAEKIIEQEARELHNAQKKLELEIDWTQGGVTGRRKRNVRRMRELGRLREKISADKAAYNKATAKIEMDALEATKASHRLVEFKHVSKSFERDSKQIPILNDFNLTILRGDRIGILGRNGSGKSTFLKLLVNELQPDSGLIRRGKTISISYFDQNRVELKQRETIWKTLAPDGDYVFLGSGENAKPRHVCGYLKDFLFDPKIARDYVSTLSGGQQNRLMLAKLLAQPGNVLILDEPTNDLDMDTLDILQEIIGNYDGTLIVVSHDRDFLDRTVTEILAFEGNAKVENFIGGYSDYLEAKANIAVKQKAPKKIEEPKKLQPAKISFKFKHELEKLPGRIVDLQTELLELSEIMSDAGLYINDPEKFDKTSRHHAQATVELDKAETRWLELTEMFQGQIANG